MLAALAVRESAAVLRVELLQLDESRRRRAGASNSSRDPLDSLREANRVEPDVRIRLRAPETGRASAPSRDVDRVLERGLEPAADVDDELGVANRLDVARRELDVVGLGAGRREVDDLVRAARDLLRRPGERIEGRRRTTGGSRDESSAFETQPASASALAERQCRRPLHRRDGSTSLRTGIIISMRWTRRGARSGFARRADAAAARGDSSSSSSASRTAASPRRRSTTACGQRGGRVGIASVYRALDGLDELGLVQRIDLGDGIARFEPAHAGGDHHHHLVCDDCGKVEPFEDPSLESAIERVADGRGYVVAAHDVVLRGACEDCRTERD